MRRGFTLIELLVVVAIVGVMMAGALLTLDSGRGAARMREAARGVAQLTHYANALALLRQRPVVVTYSQKTLDGGKSVARIDVQLSGESMAAASAADPADPIYREVNGQDTSAAGAAAARMEIGENAAADGGDGLAERTGAFFTRKILDPDELAKEDASREFEGVSLEFELLGEDGAALDARTATELKSQAEGILNNRRTAIAAWSNTSGDIVTQTEEEEEETAPRSSGHVIFETNGNCQPHRITLRMDGDGKSEGVEIMVKRSGKTVMGDEEEDT